MQQIATTVWYSSLVENMSVQNSKDSRFLCESSHSMLCNESKLLPHYLLCSGRCDKGTRTPAENCFAELLLEFGDYLNVR